MFCFCIWFSCKVFGLRLCCLGGFDGGGGAVWDGGVSPRVRILVMWPRWKENDHLHKLVSQNRPRCYFFISDPFWVRRFEHCCSTLWMWTPYIQVLNTKGQLRCSDLAFSTSMMFYKHWLLGTTLMIEHEKEHKILNLGYCMQHPLTNSPPQLEVSTAFLLVVELKGFFWKIRQHTKSMYTNQKLKLINSQTDTFFLK